MKKDPKGIVRKRSLIEKTRKNVLLWVGAAASIVSAVIVISSMLIQTAIFNQSILTKKNDTLKKIEKNIEIAPDLKADISKLDTNQELRLVRPNEEASALQTILDALPADENRLALGASLQKKILEMAPGVKIDSLSVDPANAGVSIDESNGLKSMSFSMAISGSPESLKEAVRRLEKSIRAFSVVTINGSAQGKTLSLQVNGIAYYFPPANLGLIIKEVKQK